MANTTFNRVGAGVEDLLLGDSTATVNQTRSGPAGDLSKAVTPIDDAQLPASTASKTAVGLTGSKTIKDVVVALASASALSSATTTTQGKLKVDANMAGDPVALTTGGTLAGRIPTTAQDAALDAALNASGSNEFVTMQRLDRITALALGSGKDGYGQIGTISGTPAAPTLTDAGATANALSAGTYYYQIQAYNLSGQGTASSPSSSITVASGRAITLTLPALPTNSMGWRIYRSTDAVNYYFVGQAVNGWNYFPSASQTFTDVVTYPNTSLTPPASSTGTTATMSGRYEFITLDLTGATTITVATSGSYAGFLDMRVQGLFTPASGCTITAVGANRVNVGSLRRFSTQVSTGSGGSFVGTSTSASTWGPTVTSSSTKAARVWGLGADISQVMALMSGFGLKGQTAAAGTSGDGGWGGGLIRILAYQCANNNLIGTYNATGQAGTAGTGTGAAGGGGGAGGTFDVGFVVPWKDSATENAAGGAGGNASGSGGATAINGGPGGGGGLILRRNCFDTSSAVPTVAAGANGSNVTNASGAVADVCHAGGHYGDGGFNNAGTVTSGTNGQTINLNGFYDPSALWAV